jgi:hypothetical protein
MQWINGVGKLKVTHRVKVPFAVDGYDDKVECDVLPLQVFHLLLGRPWQHDVNALHHGRTNMYTFMHKGEFYALLPKDAKAIKCTIEVFKKKSAHRRSKPRTVLLQGREDDAVLSTAIYNSVKAERYVVPARHQQFIEHTKKKDRAGYEVQKDTSIMTGAHAIQIVSPQEVKPTFRTPCHYMMIGAIKVEL